MSYSSSMNVFVFSDLYVEPQLSPEIPAKYYFSESYDFPLVENAILVFIFSDLYKNYSRSASKEIKQLVDNYHSTNSVLLLSDLHGNALLSDISHYDFSFGFYAQMPLSKVCIEKIAIEIKSFIRHTTRGALKCCLVDLDNTLIPGVWEEEKEAIAIEYQKPSSGSFHSLKMFLKKQASYGAQVIIISKNDRSSIIEALEFIDSSWNQWITHVDSGWGVKHERIIQMLERMEISAEDCLVIDDNPIELGSIEEHIPFINRQIFTNNFQHFVRDLKSKGLYLFGKASFNEERKEYYKRQLSASSKQKQQHIKINYEYNLFENNPAHIERVIELSSKTNQFNLNKIALNASELTKYRVFTWDCETQYGPLGVVGFALISNVGELTNFALSCRALGFGLEHAVFNEINSKHRIQSIAFKKTDKNKVAQEFLNTIAVTHQTNINLNKLK
jgi:FkbH-like protein